MECVMKLLNVCLCLIVLFCLVACGETGNKSEGVAVPNAAVASTPVPTTTATKEKTVMDSLHVELDVFSGRVNPSWDLTQEETTDFNSKVVTLSQNTTGKISDNLGYRGFVVTVSTGINVKFKIYNTTIQREENGKILYYNDPNREIEKWLLTTSQQYIDSTLYQNVKTQITQSPKHG